VTGTTPPPGQGPGHGQDPTDDDRAAKRAEAAAKLDELMSKLRAAQTRLDAALAESRELQDKLRQLRPEEDPSPNGV
jgi:chromosome segregation ATPase